MSNDVPLILSGSYVNVPYLPYFSAFQQRPSDVTKQVGEPAFLACSSLAGIFWKKNEVPLQVSLIIQTYIVLHNFKPFRIRELYMPIWLKWFATSENN
jgi:hypothetical protein